MRLPFQARNAFAQGQRRAVLYFLPDTGALSNRLGQLCAANPLTLSAIFVLDRREDFVAAAASSLACCCSNAFTSSFSPKLTRVNVTSSQFGKVWSRPATVVTTSRALPLSGHILPPFFWWVVTVTSADGTRNDGRRQ